MTTWIFWVIVVCLLVAFGVGPQLPRIIAWRRRRQGVIDDGPGMYGDGTDGDLYVAGDVVLTRDMHFRNIKPRPNTSGGTIYANGYRIHVKGTLTMMEGRGVVQVRRGLPPTNDGGTA